MANTTGKKFGGRKSGTVNKTTKEHRVLISMFISKNWSVIQRQFNKMKPKDQLIFFDKLLKYCVPTLSSISGTIDYSRLTDEELDKIILKLKQASDEQNE